MIFIIPCRILQLPNQRNESVPCARRRLEGLVKSSKSRCKYATLINPAQTYGAPRSVLPGSFLDELQACRWSHLWHVYLSKVQLRLDLFRSFIIEREQIFKLRFPFVLSQLAFDSQSISLVPILN